jgi:superfamily II DNA or RNA helicase
MTFKSLSNNEFFFAVSLQEHKYLGATFTAHIIKLLSSEAGIYTIEDNLFPENIEKWRAVVPEIGEKVVKILDEVSDSYMFKVVGKGKKSLAHFYETIHTDKIFGDYVQSFFERRIAKCHSLLVGSDIPVFLKEKGFGNLYQDHILELKTRLSQPVFKFSVSPIETRYALEASCDGEIIKLKHKDFQIISNEPCIIRLGFRVFQFESIDSKKLIPFFTKEYLTIPKSAEQKYFETFVLNAIRSQIVIPEGFTIEDSGLSAKAILMLETKLDGNLGLVLYFKYGSKNYLANAKIQREVHLKMINESYYFTRFGRNTDWEASIKEVLKGNNIFNDQGAEYIPQGISSDYELVDWVNQNKVRLEENGITIEQQASGVAYYLNGYYLDLKAKMENDWFDVFGIVRLGNFEFPFIHLRKHIIKNIREFILPNGEVFIIPELWFARFKPLFIVGKVENEKLVLGNSSFCFIKEAEIVCPEVSELYKRFENVNITDHIEIPSSLNAILREYQKQGLLWLQVLRSCSMGGCLADDMGLGKTIQTLAMLLYDAEQRKVNGLIASELGITQMGHTSLLVVPTSLLFNWQREVKRFAPSLSIYQFTGPNRTRSITELVNYDIVLTTYGVLRNDIDLLKDVRFNYTILDESQTIKNPASKVYRSAMLLKAKHYLSLSGTPIENSLTDLWAQLNFLNRGMLGSLKSFREEFIWPIEKGKDEKSRKRLKELVQPFILRRNKHQVAPELPQITEQIIFCSLAEEQKAIYEKEKSEIRNHILENIDSIGYSQSAISILRGLTRLRQISNHPSMLDEYQNSNSGKFDEIARTIETLVEENHKILIFSSFVKHLRIIENHLVENSIGYQMLIGSTTNRQQIVDRFQNDTTTQVFLISIKAGGVGLNLTAADYILVLDPWWNPAVENQAIARAHRIGQDKRVFVYRFISVDTVEEKIQRLQESKLLLSEEFVNNSNPLSVISKEQIIDILS